MAKQAKTNELLEANHDQRRDGLGLSRLREGLEIHFIVLLARLQRFIKSLYIRM